MPRTIRRAPTVSAYSPVYNDAEVGLRPEIRVAFNEAINPISINNGTFYLYYPGVGVYIRSTITVAADRRSALLTPDVPLEKSTQDYYYLTSFEDLVGNIGSLGGVYFRTANAADTVAPSVVAISPAAGTTNVPVNARVRVTFSEPVDGTSISSSTIQLTPSVAGAYALSTDRLSLLFTPSANLSVSTTYAIQVGAVRDSSGNTGTPVGSSFTTSASATADTIAPTVVSLSPTNGASNVAVNAPVVMTVSEPVRTGDFASSMPVFANVVGYGWVQLPGTYSTNPNGTVITFTPIAPYPSSTQMTVYSNYDSQLVDLAGNVLQYISSNFTTAATGDTTAPTIVMVSPTDGATGIGSQATVTLTFSEPLLPSTINGDTFALFAGGSELSTSVSRSADNRTVFLSASLPFESQITVVATGDVTDLAGNPLLDFSSTFTTGSTFEANRPQIVTQRPSGSGIAADANITLIVNKPLDASTVPDAFYLAQNGVLVEGALTVSGGGTAIHFNPAGNLTPGALVQVFVTSAATDAFGNALYDYSGSFTVAGEPTTQAPTIVRTSPVFYSAGNATNAVIDIEFNEPLLPATVVSANLYVVNAANQPLAGTLSLRNGDRVVRFTPAAPFVADSYNYIYLTTGLRDLQNTPFAGTSAYFYTGAGADATPPAVASVAPPDGTTAVGVNATVRVYFSEGINPVTVTSATLSLAHSAGPIPTSVTFNSANTIVTLVPLAPLPESTQLTLTVSGIEDPAGAPVAPLTSRFTTGISADTVRPNVIATNVTAYGVTNVPTNSAFQLTFDEPMDAATVLSQTATFLYDYGFGYRPGTGSISSDGLTYTFVPSGLMAVNRQHSINMSLGYDLAGNAQNSYSLYFTTTLAADTTPPLVTAVNPAAGATGTPRNALVQVRFSESVSAASLGNVRLLSNGSTPVAVTRTLSDSNRVLTLRPSSLLASSRSYTVSVAGVRDTSNNVMSGTFTSAFTTGSRTDLIGPTVVGTSPVSEDHGVGTNMVARVTFSEPIDPLLLNIDTFRIANVDGGSYLDAVVAVAADRRSATLTPSAPLRPYTRYYFQLSSIMDVAGNGGSGTFIYFYTGAGLDATPPAVVAIAPSNGLPSLPVNTRVTVVMSELIDPTSVTNASIQLGPAAAGTVTLASDRVSLTFVPSANLTASTAYSIVVSGLRDTSSNTMSPATFGFTTGASTTPDATAPGIVSRTPTTGSAGVGVTSLLTFTTTERITATAVGPGSVPVFAVISGVGTYQLAGQYAVDTTGTVITFAVTGAFPANSTIQWYTNYNSTIRDMVGLLLPNQLAQFTTANVTDTAGPSVQSVTPSNGATDVGTVRNGYADVLGIRQSKHHQRQYGRVVRRPVQAVAEHQPLDRQPDGLPLDAAATRPDHHRGRDERGDGHVEQRAQSVQQHVQDGSGIRRDAAAGHHAAADRKRRVADDANHVVPQSVGQSRNSARGTLRLAERRPGDRHDDGGVVEPGDYLHAHRSVCTSGHDRDLPDRRRSRRFGEHGHSLPRYLHDGCRPGLDRPGARPDEPADVLRRQRPQQCDRAGVQRTNQPGIGHSGERLRSRRVEPAHCGNPVAAEWKPYDSVHSGRRPCVGQLRLHLLLEPGRPARYGVQRQLLLLLHWHERRCDGAVSDFHHTGDRHERHRSERLRADYVQ